MSCMIEKAASPQDGMTQIFCLCLAGGVASILCMLTSRTIPSSHVREMEKGCGLIPFDYPATNDSIFSKAGGENEKKKTDGTSGRQQC